MQKITILFFKNFFKYLVANATFLGIYFIFRYSTVLVVLSAGFGLAAGMHWSSLDKIVSGLKSVEELYPSPPLGDDSADTSQLLKEKNLHG